MAEYCVTFAAGASYGLTTVLVGQPLDTIKTRMQGMPSNAHHNSFTVGWELFRREGMKGLYRGGVPLFVGGSFMRSAQFGASGIVKHWLDTKDDVLPTFKFFGVLDWQVVAAGIAGGLARGIVEIPTDFLKVRRQVERTTWQWSHLLDGTVITLVRNSVLFSAFICYVDLARQATQAGYIPTQLVNADGTNLTPFAKGALCANAAWLTVWPADVVKTQLQSGNYDIRKNGIVSLLIDNARTGRLFRGVVPGLIRSSIANGSSMVVYEHVHTTLSSYFQLHERLDMA
jgi:solute carrier family 25 (mitochondrial carnitine/acylcarnitine transporter), member 20/29